MYKNDDFPPLRNDLILRAARGEKVNRVPLWIMRQAGRYLPEFREFRTKHSFFEICQTPELACEVTLQPLMRFELDAAIIFSDILVVIQAMGLEVVMVEAKGPVLPNPLVAPVDLKRLKSDVNIKRDLGYVLDAITLTRRKLDGRVPLIGFAGAPWTLMAYMIEGGSSTTHSKAKSWFYKYPEAAEQLLDALTAVIIEFLIQQVLAGAQMLQIFESHAGALTPALFEEFELPRLRKISRTVKQKVSELSDCNVPLIIFAKDGHYAFDLLCDSQFDVVSLDWTCRPAHYRRLSQNKVTLQGNLDPVILTSTPNVIKAAVKKMVKEFGTQRYICNLGHGIYPDASPENVSVLVDYLRYISHDMCTSTE